MRRRLLRTSSRESIKEGAWGCECKVTSDLRDAALGVLATGKVVAI